ncbi:Insulinase (Peptidase family M16) [Posidoniimonas corsicana]|uniref:Insulinase (Peptidase family M16) n=1 Tax=Posidoniimonas corsicana TaxID=1938618 RepID=A0A5C5VA90_9BACT|nr:pitrilysin family protein [Posidoniimonas corsicana]TWT35524.1 Insulinase (Peptidase family M16) [Posidoniimonas corsicana]
MEFRSHTLPNGLQIVAECNELALSTALGAFVSAGARDETDDVAGVSHFLEHMAFKGTPRRSAEDVNREFDEIGAHYNAYTSEEHTVYYGTVLPEYQRPCVDLLTDIVRPSLRTEDFEMEKQVILEEIQMYLDQPPYGADEQVKLLCFGQHPVARSVLGTSESVSGLTPEAMRSYFDSRYGPATVTFVASGAVDFDDLVKQVEGACGGWSRTEDNRCSTDITIGDNHDHVAQAAATQQYLLKLTAGPDAGDSDRYAAKLLTMAVGDDSGSRMYWDLVDPGHVESASLGHYEYQDLGMYYTWMSCAPQDLEANLVRLNDVLAQAQEDGLTQDELDRARSKIKSRVVIGNERPRSRLFSVGVNWLHRREYRTAQQDLDSIEAVTLADVRRVLQRYPLTSGATLTVGPREKIAWP